MPEPAPEKNERTTALAAMQSLFAGFETRIVRQRMLPHPGEGSLYDLDPNRISRRSYRRGELTPGGSGPFRRREAVGLLHKPMLGQSAVKVFVALDYAWGGNAFTAEAVHDAARWALAPLRADVYFILALAGEWRPHEPAPGDDLMGALTGGSNWRACLLQHVSPGWNVVSPTDGAILPTLFENLFDPEPLDQKVARVDAALAAASELRQPGGFVMLEELAARIAVSHQLVLDRAVLFAQRTPGLDVKDVGGNVILQRNRFQSLTA